MEEGMGFEPTKGVTLYTLSKRAPSTTRTPLRKAKLKLSNRYNTAPGGSPDSWKFNF
jgi:hypothetical protein